jgi:hypothetical protein
VPSQGVTWSYSLCVAETASKGSSAAYAARDVAGFVALLTHPFGPVPLAARGLAAVLARAGPAGLVVAAKPALPRTGAVEQPRHQSGAAPIRPGIVHIAPPPQRCCVSLPRWPATTIDAAIATRYAARTKLLRPAADWAHGFSAETILQ